MTSSCRRHATALVVTVLALACSACGTRTAQGQPPTFDPAAQSVATTEQATEMATPAERAVTSVPEAPVAAEQPRPASDPLPTLAATATTSAEPIADDGPGASPQTAVVVRSGTNVGPIHAVGEPLSISIPAIGVRSALLPVGVLTDGTVAVPEDPDVAGWFTGGPRPGERGPAVIMGHVDSKESGPGVFWRLRDLPVGAIVTIETTSGAHHFVVHEVQRHPKDQFPTDAVYGPVPTPALRLITCGGSFDRAIGHYRDNVIAFLVPVPA